MAIAYEENVARAICSDKTDGVRIAPSLFKGMNTSVSRLAVASLEETWHLFQNKVAKPPERRLKMIGEINAGRLHDIGTAHNPSIPLTVEPAPEDDFASHAVIPQNITRGLANKIVNALIHHRKAGR